jgi:hypothetical protein
MSLQLVAAAGALLKVSLNFRLAFWLERFIQVIVEQLKKGFTLFRCHCN